MNPILYKIQNISDLYVDAFLTDQIKLIFLSVWGRDTTLQELMARLSLPRSEQGLDELQLGLPGGSATTIHIPNIDQFDKVTGRTQTTLFGEMAHCFLFDKRLTQSAYCNQTLLLYQSEQQCPDIWATTKAVSHLPLRDHWKNIVMTHAVQQQWIQYLQGVGINAVKFDFDPEQLEIFIQDSVQNGILTLNISSN